jgi:predicted ATP-binding protein involved in virulence
MGGFLMKLVRISVTDLFGIFNHDISFNTREKITIITGPNGYGKTIILRLIYTFFSLSLRELILMRVPFNEFLLQFDDNSTITVENTKDQDKGQTLHIVYRDMKGKKKGEYSYALLSRQMDLPIRYLERFIDEEIPELRHIGPNRWRDVLTGELLTRDEIYRRYGDRLGMTGLKGEKTLAEPQWLTEIRSIKVNLIDTQRTIKAKRSREDEPRPVASSPTASTYSRELTNIIKSKLADYASLSQSLDSSFPKRLVQGINKNTYSDEELEIKYEENNQKRSSLVEVGLLEKEEPEIDFKELKDSIPKNRDVLSVYVDDISKKLSTFDDLYKQINLFLNIINARFGFKQMEVDKVNGFVFRTPENIVIPPESLSSGEQHEFVLFYELLFNGEENSLVLIDEPEISLHVEWQVRFIRDLQETLKLSNFDVLIATHSPDIIGSRSDLTVELKGPK